MTELQSVDAMDAGLTAVVAHGVLNALQGAVSGPRFFRAGADPNVYCPLIRSSLQHALATAEDLDPPSGRLLQASLLPAARAAEDLESRLDAQILASIEEAARRAEAILRSLVQGLPDDAVQYLDELNAQSLPRV
ncbi:MAG: hypothetical protein QOE35_2999 [Actinomycetota bacterium]|jgi:hypothetical protein